MERSGDAAEHFRAVAKHSVAEVERSGTDVKDFAASVEHSLQAEEERRMRYLEFGTE